MIPFIEKTSVTHPKGAYKYNFGNITPGHNCFYPCDDPKLRKKIATAARTFATRMRKEGDAGFRLSSKSEIRNVDGKQVLGMGVYRD